MCQGGVVFLFCICMHEFSQFGFNDETWLNVRLTRYLEKGTIGCRNVGEKCFVGTKYLFSSFKQTYILYFDIHRFPSFPPYMPSLQASLHISRLAVSSACKILVITLEAHVRMKLKGEVIISPLSIYPSISSNWVIEYRSFCRKSSSLLPFSIWSGTDCW